jgi:hypothetical protein
MSDDTERSVESAGSQPEAWAVEWKGDTTIDRSTVCYTEDAAKRRADECPALDGVAVPLYRQPQHTLTDEERDVLDRLAHDASYRRMEWTERVLRGLLKRLK